ncbi:MAG: tRNA preQ1(34) S-adenosylmethionine ribosyltransferase-isomerase QueA [Desulfuromonadaceae bacterium]|nr:tRNA preQ1(34) S-adenosylmethionine ribosyltransferase-isomerase QueA [Desulfuromonadaceae bacterium]
MKLTDFDYTLPSELIAQYPTPQRDASRLLVVRRDTGSLQDEPFSQISHYFRAGDVLVVNDTRVIPARLLGRKQTGGQVEVFLVRRLADQPGQCWLCLTRSSKAPRPGMRLELDQGLTATVVETGEQGYRTIRFDYDGDFLALLEQIGQVPLPPYIQRAPAEADRERYQTTFSAAPGAVAAPTAGLHFTPQILDELRQKGVIICPLTLHVGLGTFLPVRVENVREHRMHAEAFAIPQATADAVNDACREGRRVVALGTTVTRTLEHAATARGCVVAGEGLTDIFIYPGYQFKVVDALVTNFHLPQSTLLMLVSALAGRELMLQAYAHAVEQRYRFFSYGDCMLIC